ncbi:GNAT family N-acetyltransferase [Halocynthiibacter sp.]|uniref:GNAT family N-acetyltransferase n=1 Tax=Halocynthiibacter sp. TaxID=1979210 RepID=UPI003C549631
MDSVMIPDLATDRLRLRVMDMTDWPEYRAMMMSDHARYMGGPYDEKGAWSWFCHDIAQWHLLGHGALMVDRADGTTVGQVCLNAGPLFPERELGWFLYSGYEGHGYASEAAAALRDWAFANLDIETLVSYVDEGNLASARVAQRLNAVVDESAAKPDPEDIVYRHIRP